MRTGAIILASNSPRRRELLRQVGIEFTAAPAVVDERRMPDEQPEAYALRVASDKARATAEGAKSGIVIAADTIVVLDDQVLGKPSDVRDAERMLGMLSGKAHRVVTGLVVLDVKTGRTASRTTETKVWFRKLSNGDIRSYAASGEPLDKAGAYGIQGLGALLVEKIEGCYYNVVGLPLSALSELLTDFGLPVFRSARRR